MPTTTLTNPASVAQRLVTYLSKRLLEVQVDALVLDQFAVHEELPANVGSQQISFFKPEKAATGLYTAPTAANVVSALTEGTAIAAFRENDWTRIQVTLKQYGAATKISDLVSMVDAYQPLKQNIELMGRDAALHTDTLIRNALVGSNHPDGSTTPLTHNANGSGAEIFVSSAGAPLTTNPSSTAFNTMKALTQAQTLCTRLLVLASITRLRVNKAPRLKNDRYVGLIPPQVIMDLVRDADYKTAFQGRGPDGVYKRMLGDIDGCSFVEHTNPYIEDETYGTYSQTDTVNAGLLYSNLFLGASAYGTPKLAGTKSPLRPQMFINDKPDKSDPLNQFIIAGWKAYYMAMGLDVANIVNLRTKSTFA
jgi:N4-gp56 family major capsid protein